MNTQLASAIHEQRVISFFYEKDGAYRKVCPTKLVTTPKGETLLEAYLVGGYSQSGNAQPWRLYNVAEMSFIRLLDTTFSRNNISGYHANDKRFPLIIREL